MKPPFLKLQEMALPPIIQTGSKGYLVSDFTLRLGSGFTESQLHRRASVRELVWHFLD